MNGCARCYGLYRAQRDLSHELSVSLPRVGQPNVPQLGRMWAAIQADMQRPQRVVNRQLLTRSGVACLILVLSLLLPWSLNNQQVALAVPSQPAAPKMLSATNTPPLQVALAAATEAVDTRVTDSAIPAAETPNTATTIPATH